MIWEGREERNENEERERRERKRANGVETNGTCPVREGGQPKLVPLVLRSKPNAGKRVKKSAIMLTLRADETDRQPEQFSCCWVCACVRCVGALRYNGYGHFPWDGPSFLLVTPHATIILCLAVCTLFFVQGGICSSLGVWS